MNDAFRYHIESRGANAEVDYPYTAIEVNCTSSGKAKYFPYTHINATAPTLAGICSAVLGGPISAAVHVNENF